MAMSELLLQPSCPSYSYFHSNLDPNMEVYAGDHHEFSSSITTTSSSFSSSANLAMLSPDSMEYYPFSGYDHGNNPSLVNMEGFDDVCRWLCDDGQEGMEESTPNPSEKSSEASVYVSHKVEADDAMEIDSKEGIKNLLMAFAEAMGMGQEELAKVIVKCINEKVNPNGSPLERLAHNLFEPDQEAQGEAYLRLESFRNFNPAFRAIYDIFPYGRFAHFTASSSILEAVPTHVNSLHIVDFDIGEGTQWPPVIEAIARTKISLTITSIKLEDQESRFEGTKRQLLNFARSCGLHFNIQEIGIEQIVKATENDQFVAFNCMVGLPHMGRTRRTTQVTEFLKVAKMILAKHKGIITFGNGEEGERMRSLDYTSFFERYLGHYKALYESMEWGFPSYLNDARMAMETLFVAPYVSYVSWFQKWKEGREDMVGVGQKMSKESWNEAREMVKEGESPYVIKVEGDNENEMVLEWRGTPLVRVSAWR